MQYSRSAVLWLGLGLVSTSCTSLPDTSGYTGATVQLRTSVRQAGEMLGAELARGIAAIPAEARSPDLATASTRFDSAWASTVRSMDALGHYAESIESLSAAGDEGGASGQVLAQSVLGLAGAVGLAPAAAVGGVVAETASMIYGAVANIRAARSLDRSLSAADPVIQDIGLALDGQVASAQAAFAVAIAEQRNALDERYEPETDLDRRLAEQSAAVAAATLAPGASYQDAAERLRAGREAIAPRLSEYRAAVHELDERERTAAALFAATRSGLQTWRASHTQLAAAVRERRPVTIQSLLAASEDIRNLIGRWRQL